MIEWLGLGRLRFSENVTFKQEASRDVKFSGVYRSTKEVEHNKH